MFSPPVRSAGREPKRSVRLPAKVKTAILLMVYGDPARPDELIDFIAAAKLAGVQPDNMRRWLHRPEAASLLRKERAAYRLALTAGNESALARIRDKSENAMAVVRSCQVLSEWDREEFIHPSGHPRPQPGLVVQIITPASPRPVAAVVDVVAEPAREPGDDRACD
jgi:hypothetical protein